VKVKLVCQDPLASPREIVLERFPVEIGRGTTAGLRIDDRWTSRRHCELKEHDSRLMVHDLGSRHGTFVNGQRVVEAMQILPGDELCIGMSHFLAVYDPETQTIAAAIAPTQTSEHAFEGKSLVCLTL
jgi:pSer/pThr/pTyr-binding forkhead associated (FHA) protein